MATGRSRLAGTALALCLALGAGSGPAWAQAGGAGGGAGGAGGGAGTGQFPGAAGIQPEVEVTRPLIPTPPPVFAGKLFGDWGGLRTRLLNRGV
ncbi:MAG TPA: hypothetical protein VJ779_19665, partial [Acetobacteraceae bacterium]|nr:hypothetical protein [Acetobacteraceae bacterium]